MKHKDAGAVPATSTIPHSYGGEPGSTVRIEIERDQVTPDRNRTKTVTVANDNYITEAALAA